MIDCFTFVRCDCQFKSIERLPIQEVGQRLLIIYRLACFYVRSPCSFSYTALWLLMLLFWLLFVLTFKSEYTHDISILLHTTHGKRMDFLFSCLIWRKEWKYVMVKPHIRPTCMMEKRDISNIQSECKFCLMNLRSNECVWHSKAKPPTVWPMIN